MRALRVLHFASGGFSGATQVAIDLCGYDVQQRTLLVLRRRRNDPTERVAQLRARGIEVEIVPRWPHWLTVWQLARICRAWQPDILVAHGFSDHLWGRYAGLLAGVPHLVQVEHNVRERYGWWRRHQSLWLARRTDAIVGVSEAVRCALIRSGHPAERCVTIHNGIELERFDNSTISVPWERRESAVVMAARFARQKDHVTVIRAARVLVDRGAPMMFYFLGSGRQTWRRRAEQLVAQLGVSQWVQFVGYAPNVGSWYQRVRYCALSSHYEGLPLALIEGMASGCCAIGSNVEGIRDVIDDGHTGRLVTAGDPIAWADALMALEANPQRAAQMAMAGRERAHARFDRRLMRQRYHELFTRLCTATQ